MVDKYKILFACTAGINRSRAFASLFDVENAEFIGVERSNQHELDKLSRWANRIIIFEEEHRKYFAKRFSGKIRCMDIPDRFYWDGKELRDD